MNSKWIKIIAALTMTIDHIGLYLISYELHPTLYLIFRSIGRIAFPLFAFSVAQGFLHTSNRKRYFVQLLTFACSIEAVLMIWWLVSGDNEMMIGNVFWVLVMGLGGLFLLSSKKWYYMLLAFAFVPLADFINFPYAGYGILMIYLFGLNRRDLYILGLLLLLHLFYIQYPIGWLTPYETRYMGVFSIQWFDMLALPLIYLYNNQRGKYNKYIFYVYYPLHIMVIFLISYFIQ